MVVEAGEAASDTRAVQAQLFGNLPDCKTVGMTAEQPDHDVLTGMQAMRSKLSRPDRPHQLTNLAQLASQPLRVLLLHTSTLRGAIARP